MTFCESSSDLGLNPEESGSDEELKAVAVSIDKMALEV
jgi:hypothetical protein